jgi:hypothetical protein
MNRSATTAVTLAAALAIAAPLSAYSQNPPQGAPNQPPAGQQQAQPPAQGQPGGGAAGGPQANQPMGQGMGGMMGRGMGGMMGMMEHGHGMMMGHGWRHGWMHRPSAQRCRDRLARRAAAVAYVVTELDLSPQQDQIWDNVENALEQGVRREQQLCNVLEPGAQNAPENILDLVNLREQVLQAQLQTLQHARPALQQLYQSLSPRQKDIINRVVGRG